MSSKGFNCQGREAVEIPEEVVEKRGLTFPQVHTNCRDIVTLARGLKEYHQDSICKVPFCTTVEAEALGAEINLGDQQVGPRVGNYCCDQLADLTALGELDLDQGRIKEVLAAVEELSQLGERVALKVEGPWTIISSLIDATELYKAAIFDKELINQIIEQVVAEIERYILAGLERGADIISYADPVGTKEIVGPKIYRELSGRATYQLLSNIEPELGAAVVHLCGKTSTAFEELDFSKSQALNFADLTYGAAICEILANYQQINFIGHRCIKQTPYQLQNNLVWQLELL
ncbi:MAG: uroporphyrinogen decarboxylase family protein [Bacillota bacterium]